MTKTKRIKEMGKKIDDKYMELVNFVLTAADWIEDEDIKNMTKVKILSRMAAIQEFFKL